MKLSRNHMIAAAIMVVIALVVYRIAMPRRQRDGFLGGLLKGVMGGVGKLVGMGGKEAAGQAGTQAQAAPAKTNPVPKGGCQYKTRIWINNGWGCEPGWYDTGANWEFGANGDKQCENCSAPTPGGGGRTNAPGRAGCQYKTRSWINNGWGCEGGWNDTGANWDYGPNGEKQCEKC